MQKHLNFDFSKIPAKRSKVGLEEKVRESSKILRKYINDKSILKELSLENFLLGIIPRLSPFDEPYLPKNVTLIKVPKDLSERNILERSYDLTRWNKPSQFLGRLQVSKIPFVPPVTGESRVMDKFTANGKVVSFDDLRIGSPEPVKSRHSRSKIDNNLEINIMGQGRIPFALGSVPDVGSYLSYTTMAMSNGMALVSRDKILSNALYQAEMIKKVITTIKNVHLPVEIYPTGEDLKEFIRIQDIKKTRQSRKTLLEIYFETLRNSWISNVGAAIDTDSKEDLRATKRAQILYKAGCRLFRIYSPEGGMEIVDTVKNIKKNIGKDKHLKIIAGQIMDASTARKAQEAGADALIIGVAGGSQCTTSVNADIPVNTPNLLYELREQIHIPIGVEGGGVGTHIMTAFALGASFLSKAGEIGVSLEGAGGEYVFVDEKGDFYTPYGGEASVSAKWWKDSMDDLGRTKFVEGETGIRKIINSLGDDNQLSQTGNIRRLRNRLSIGLVFQRASSIVDLHERSCKNIFEMSLGASALSQPYGR